MTKRQNGVVPVNAGGETSWALRAHHVAKAYTIKQVRPRHRGESGAHGTGAHGTGAQRTRPLAKTETFWALQDVSFDVRRGEVVGIIGRNGAGKSTLLKILSRITEPTNGRIDLFGRVGSLLEVGTGFHRELTGRENIFLNGSILGMKRREIERQFDEIVDFSGVEAFLDTPVKRYSSGMFVRLAFAVAAHLRSEIMIVDEVLAVGDDQFQRKCLGKMGQVAKDGRTVLFVSHNMQAVSTLTQRCVLLNAGRVEYDGDPSGAIAAYLREGTSGDLVYVAEPDPQRPKITRVELRTSRPANVQTHGEPMEIVVTIQTPGPVDGARLAIKAIDPHRRAAMYVWRYDSEGPILRTAGRHVITCRVPKTRLYMGRFSLLVHFGEKFGGERFEDLEAICPFEVVMYGIAREGAWFPEQGTFIEDVEWDVRPVAGASSH